MKKTTGKISRPQRVVLYGVESVGKTTFAAQWPSPLFIDIEGGSQKLDIERWELESQDDQAKWKELLQALAEAKKTDHRTIVFDSIDCAERICADAFCAEQKKKSIEDFGYGKGYAMVSERMAKVLSLFDDIIAAGKHVVIIAHSQIKRFEAPDALAPYDRYELKLHKQTSPIVKEWSDELWFLRFKTKVATTDSGKAKGLGGKDRILLTTHAAAYDAKTRSGLAEELPLEWDSVRHLFDRNATSVAPESTEDFTKDDAVALLESKELSVNRFLLDRGKIAAGDTWRECDSVYLNRILGKTADFMLAVTKWEESQ
jgi:hypothetical protein